MWIRTTGATGNSMRTALFYKSNLSVQAVEKEPWNYHISDLSPSRASSASSWKLLDVPCCPLFQASASYQFSPYCNLHSTITLEKPLSPQGQVCLFKARESLDVSYITLTVTSVVYYSMCGSARTLWFLQQLTEHSLTRSYNIRISLPRQLYHTLCHWERKF